MEVNPLVFETSASTDSAIWAYALAGSVKCGAKISLTFQTRNSFIKKRQKKQEKRERHGFSKKYPVH